MDDFKKLPNENERQYIWRIGKMVDSGKITNWEEAASIINSECREDDSEYKVSCAYRKPYQNAKGYYEDVFSHMVNDEYANRLVEEKRDIYKERVKLQTEKAEYNKWLRENARDELLLEKFTDSIANCKPFNSPSIIPQSHSERECALFFGDEHDGVEFQIKGLFGEILNEYSPEIFEKRMWDLLNDIVSYIQREGFTTLNVFNLGDYADGVLRIGQLMRLRWGVVDSTVHYEEFISNWLYELTKYARVNFQMVFGNHSELRFFNQPSGSFGDENMGKVVIAYIKQKMKDNPNFVYVENPSGLIYSNIAGYNLLGIHGNVKDMKKAIGEFSNFYNVKLDYLVSGHLHHSEEEEIGVCKETIRVPSIIGVDPFAQSIRTSASAGAKILCFEKGQGITDEHRIKLN